jgi:hypothetical protein
MRSPGPGGFLGFGHVLRSLTMSPVASALDQAHRMARRHLEAGGAAAPASAKPNPVPASTKAKPSPQVGGDFYLPADLDPAEIEEKIRSKLSGSRSTGNSGEVKVLGRKVGGRVVVPAAHLLRLGDGNFAKGRRYLHGLVWQIRRQRIRLK